MAVENSPAVAEENMLGRSFAGGLPVRYASPMNSTRTLLGCFAMAASAIAAPVRDGPATVELIADVQSIAPGESFTVSLRMVLDPSWHAYWINPGDSGRPPRLDWSLPEGFSVGELRFPPPVAISTPPFMTFGMEDVVHLLAEVIPPPDVVPGETAIFSAEAEWLACKDACVPGAARIELEIPVREGPARPHPVHAEEIAAALAKLPTAADGWTFRAEFAAGRYRLHIAPPPGSAVDFSGIRFFPFAPGLVRHAAPQAGKRVADGFVLDLVPERPADPPPARLSGVLAGPDFAFRVDAPFSEVPPRSANPERNAP